MKFAKKHFRKFLYGLLAAIALYIPLECPSLLIDTLKRKPLFELNKEQIAWADSVFYSLTLEEKCAQLVFPDASTFQIGNGEENARLEKLVSEIKVGGLILFKGKVFEQIALTNRLQNLAKTPLIFASDYERGIGMRLEDAVEFPYNMALAAAGDTNLVYRMAKRTAERGRRLGVHWNFAPLADINHEETNPIINIRSFSEDTETVSKFVRNYLRGLQDGGMIATAKHFPGHGATSTDSHIVLPLISKTKAELEKSDLKPFQTAINNGIKAVMTGHLAVPSIEPDSSLPASLSEKIVGDLLKDEMEFKGLVVTDALNMRSIVKNYNQAEAAVLAINAGNDVILFPENPEEAVSGLVEAVKKGEISKNRLEISVRKILAAKAWLNLNSEKFVDTSGLRLRELNKEDEKLAAEAARRAVTLVRDEQNILPINNSKFMRPVAITITSAPKNEEIIFEDAIRKEVPAVRIYKLNRRSRSANYRRALKLARSADLILLPTFLTVRAFEGTVKLHDDHRYFINRLLKLNKPVVMLNFGNPYILNQLPDIKTYLCTFGGVDASQKAAIDAIFGRSGITGRMPVSLKNGGYLLDAGIDSPPTTVNIRKNYEDELYDFSKVDSLMKSAITGRAFPGGVLLVGYNGGIVYRKAFGRYRYSKKSPKVKLNTIYDLASLTKVVATTSATMKLIEQGRLTLSDTVANILPEFGVNGKSKITIRNLLMHNSGLPAYKKFHESYDSALQVLYDIDTTALIAEPGVKYVYSDLGMVILQKVIEKITRMSLDVFVRQNVFEPLRMENTMFNPPEKLKKRCAPTEVDRYWRHRRLQGEVHDETASLLNGVSGNAGLFSTVDDIFKLVYTLTRKGMYGKMRIFDSALTELFTSRQTLKSTRALGWDTPGDSGWSCGDYFSEKSFGHTGYTGTSIWADKESGLIVILLTNRVYPNRRHTDIIDFRPVLHNAIVEALFDEEYLRSQTKSDPQTLLSMH